MTEEVQKKTKADISAAEELINAINSTGSDLDDYAARVTEGRDRLQSLIDVLCLLELSVGRRVFLHVTKQDREASVAISGDTLRIVRNKLESELDALKTDVQDAVHGLESVTKEIRSSL